MPSLSAPRHPRRAVSGGCRGVWRSGRGHRLACRGAPGGGAPTGGPSGGPGRRVAGPPAPGGWRTQNLGSTSPHRPAARLPGGELPSGSSRSRTFQDASSEPPVGGSRRSRVEGGETPSTPPLDPPPCAQDCRRYNSDRLASRSLPLLAGRRIRPLVRAGTGASTSRPPPPQVRCRSMTLELVAPPKFIRGGCG